MSGATSGAAYPDYIAFRTTGDDGRLLTVVAALEPDNGARFPWATCYHELAPEGDFKQVPGNYSQLGVARGVAEAMIDLIKLSRPLPTEFVAHLPLIE